MSGLPERAYRASRLALVLALVAVPGLLLPGQGGAATVLRQEGARLTAAELAAVPLHRLAAVDLEDARQVDRQRAADGLPERFAEPRLVDLSPAGAGSWQMLPSTERVWRQRVSCPGAVNLNLGFTDFFLTPGARLLIYAAGGEGPVLVFTEQDHRAHGQLWTPIVPGGELVVELRLPPGTGNDWRLHLTRVGCGYRPFGEETPAKSGTCNVDVVCPEGDPWRDEIASVGVYTVSGTWSCTGVMINNTEQDERPLFLTAHHCGVGPVEAATVVVYWNFESPECGQQGGGPLDQFTSGAQLLASYDISDFTLLELAESPDPVFGVTFAGWDRSAAVPNSAVAIHHPSTDEKSISFENDPLRVTSYSEDPSPGNGTHLRVNDWDLGTTEPGSSGSPLFNAQKLVVGQLHGGYAACDNDLPDWYGRLYTSWTGSGTPETRLSNWLDPQGLGNLTLPLLDPQDGPVDPPVGSANIAIAAVAPNPFLDFVEITVDLERDAWVDARVFDLRGRLVADLGRRLLQTDDNVLAWGGDDPDGRRLPAGVYVLQLEAEGRKVQRKFVRLN